MSYRSRYQIADSQQFMSILTSEVDLNASPPDPLTREWDLLSYRAPEVDDNGRKCDRYPWIQVSVHAEEVMRDSVAPTAFRPLDSQEIRTRGQRYSQLGARLVLSDDTQQSRIVDVDIAGGFTFTWAGSGVTVKVLTQQNAGSLAELVTRQFLLGTAVVDDIVGASATVGGVGFETASGGGGSLSPVCLKLTQSKRIDLAGQEIFEIPSGACRVGIYSQDPAIAANWLAYYQGPPGAPLVAAGPIGAMPAIAVAAATQGLVPGTARALVVANTAGAAQTVTIVWEIRL